MLNDDANSEISVEYHSFVLDHLSKILYFSDPKTKKLKLCIPSNTVQDIFKLNHDGQGHPGFEKSYNRVGESFHVDKLSKKLKLYISSCPVCTASKNRKDQAGFLKPLDVPWAPLDTITMDFVNGLPKDKDFDAILTITDKFSKLVQLIPCHTTDSSSDTAELFLNTHYRRFGLPSNIVSDRDPRFIAKFWQELFRRLRVNIKLSTAYAPQTDGQSERSNQTMELMLRSLIGYDVNRKWIEELPVVEFSINSQIADGHRMSPFEVLYGSNPRGTAKLLRKSSIYDDPSITYIGRLRERIQEEALQRLHYSRTMMSLHYDKGRSQMLFKCGDKVYLENNPNYRIPGLERGKLAPRRFGPFEIIEQIGKGAFRLKLPESYKIHDVISARHLTLAKKDKWNRLPGPPPPLEDLDEGLFEVECVIDSRRNRKGKEYLVKWKDYPIWESSWINESQRSTFEEAIREFEERQKSKV